MTALFWSESLAALLAAVVAVLCVSAVLHCGYRRENGLMPYIFYQVVAVIILTALLSGRDLSCKRSPSPNTRWFPGSLTSHRFFLHLRRSSA